MNGRGSFSSSVGESLLAVGKRPAVDFYFPLVWFGYILALDGIQARVTGTSLYRRSHRLFWLMVPVSAGLWWVFELFDVGVQSWRYVNASSYQGLAFVVLASVSFSTVLLAVWETAWCVHSALPGWLDRLSTMPRWSVAGSRGLAKGHLGSKSKLHRPMIASVAFGVFSVVLPILLPRYAFGLIWISVFFLLDPVNYWLGRSSLIAEIAEGRFRTALSFGLGALICGFFWESWNYWAPMKWVYSVPFVSQFHLFEMPVPGYSGYIPFGLELYAMANFIMPSIGRFFGMTQRQVKSALGWADDTSSAEANVSISA